MVGGEIYWTLERFWRQEQAGLQLDGVSEGLESRELRVPVPSGICLAADGVDQRCRQLNSINRNNQLIQLTNPTSDPSQPNQLNSE